MKMSKSIITLFLAGILALGGYFYCFAEDAVSTDGCKIMTNAEFADVLVKVLGVNLPQDTDKLSDAEFFEVQANMLAERGITMFVGVEPKASVIKATVWEILNKALDEFASLRVPEGTAARGSVPSIFSNSIVGYSETSIEDQLAYLKSLGFGEGLEGNACSEDVLAALNNPNLSQVVAEGYSSPNDRGRVGVEAQNPIPEDLPGLLAEGPVSSTGSP